MWKFYSHYSKHYPVSQLRIILLTGDSDFADPLGQLRNLGVDIGVLTPPLPTSAPIFEDLSLAIRVLPLYRLTREKVKMLDPRLTDNGSEEFGTVGGSVCRHGTCSYAINSNGR